MMISREAIDGSTGGSTYGVWHADDPEFKVWVVDETVVVERRVGVLDLERDHVARRLKSAADETGQGELKVSGC